MQRISIRVVSHFAVPLLDTGDKFVGYYVPLLIWQRIFIDVAVLNTSLQIPTDLISPFIVLAKQRYQEFRNQNRAGTQNRARLIALFTVYEFKELTFRMQCVHWRVFQRDYSNSIVPDFQRGVRSHACQ